MAFDTGAVLAKYIELRDRKTEMGKRHSEEMAPINEAMTGIENWLMHQMNSAGVDQLKVTDVGTAFKATTTSVQMQDAGAFKDFVFAPVVEGIHNYLTGTGYGIRPMDMEMIQKIIREMVAWDMVDFRAGKKGIQDYIANENATPPGVAVNTVATIQIRRA